MHNNTSSWCACYWLDSLAFQIWFKFVQVISAIVTLKEDLEDWIFIEDKLAQMMIKTGLIRRYSSSCPCSANRALPNCGKKGDKWCVGVVCSNYYLLTLWCIKFN